MALAELQARFETHEAIRRLALASALAVALAAVYVAALRSGASLAVFWVAGLAFGFILQRARLCFASAFRDLFLLGQARMMKGILAGLAVATIGFAMVMGAIVSEPAIGGIPADAHVLPLGIATGLGGVLFGFGMVVAGGCVTGNLYRMGEGYVASWVATGGVMGGLYALNRTWNWWWERSIADDSLVWLPGRVGYTWAILLTLGGLAAVYVAVTAWERRRGPGVVLPPAPSRPAPASAFDEVGRALEAVFRRGWSPVVGGVALGALNVLLFVRYRPLGVLGEVSRWSSEVTGLVGAAPGPLQGVEDLAGCVPLASGGSWFTEAFMLNGGLVAGAFAAAVLAREFRVRAPRRRVRYVQSFAGGALMGYGGGLAIGCTIGAFFSAIPSLALNGWVFAAALTVGAYLGVLAIRRIP